jgi:hypothetical protein
VAAATALHKVATDALTAFDGAGLSAPVKALRLKNLNKEVTRTKRILSRAISQ